jgi:hypothetical protein
MQLVYHNRVKMTPCGWEKPHNIFRPYPALEVTEETDTIEVEMVTLSKGTRVMAGVRKLDGSRVKGQEKCSESSMPN